MNNFGKGFIDAFSSNMAAEHPESISASLPQNNLSTKTGVNKKKASNLQQNLINVISQTKVMPQEGA